MIKEGYLFRFVMTSLFIIFITLYISQATGYYEYQQHKKKVLTEEKIKQFEEDVQKGKKIDIEDYLEVTEYKYCNGISNTGLKLSKVISNYVQKGVDGLLKVLEKMFIN
ncbi:MAG: hypothetical protein ACOXZR_04455 [Bacilli bacterium]|jgi:hypothetical protein